MLRFSRNVTNTVRQGEVHMPPPFFYRPFFSKGRKMTRWTMYQGGRTPIRSRSRSAGFSLIELLIVVAIILILAAIAVPSYLRSKTAANEASAVGSLRTINTAEVTYASNCPAQGFAASLTELNTGAPCTAGKDLLDNVLGAAAPKKSGYTFTYTAPTDTPGTNY